MVCELSSIGNIGLYVLLNLNNGNYLLHKPQTYYDFILKILSIK